MRRLWPPLRSAARILALVVTSLLAYHTLVRIIRHFYKFPIPQFLANAIDNPWRRRLQPPDETAVRHGIEPGMTVLDIGPGNGRYSVASARRVGPHGRLIAVDIEPKMIQRTQRRALDEGVDNLQGLVASAHALPMAYDTVDLIYMIAVMGEIPSPQRAIAEFHRVLKPSGTLVFSELFFDPDYCLASTLQRWGEAEGFLLEDRIGNFFYYTLILNKQAKDTLANGSIGEQANKASEPASPTIPPTVNRIMAAVLRSPLHVLVSRTIMLITFTGRKTGRTYTTPVSYLREGDTVTLFTRSRWWKNLVGGAPVTLRIQGRTYQGWAEAIAENKAAVAADLQVFLRHVRFDARVYGVSFDADGEPNVEEVRRAAQDVVLIRAHIDLNR
jgi:ubiquinone/menaquinone biosynthesis C-methylase UbiE